MPENYPIVEIRKDFPILSRLVNKNPLVYFDNGATTQKPWSVIQAGVDYYSNLNSNIHRGVHTLSGEVTETYEQARKVIQNHLNALKPGEIVFTSGTTDSINLVANSFGKQRIKAGDRILITLLEHHSNILPWQKLCEEVGAYLDVVTIHPNGDLDLNHLQKLLTPKTKLLSVCHVSNTLGTINPIQDIIKLAHQNNTVVLVDGAQAIPHLSIDVQALDCDFYCFSGHKAYAPTGVGILYAQEKHLQEMPPYRVGGGTIKTVTFQHTLYAESPLKFEAGTPHIEGGLGLAKAIEYMNSIGIDRIAAHENNLLNRATEMLNSLPGLTIIGQSNHKAGVISFVVEGTHPADIGVLLDKYGVAVRTGHHCTQPLLQHYNVPGTVRVSFGLYNTIEEVEVLFQALVKTLKMLR